MDIGLIYSKNNPQHAMTRDFIKSFIKDRGVLARFIETDKPVKYPTITVNGCQVVEPSRISRKNSDAGLRFPTTDEIGKVLEKSIWCL